MKKLLSSVIAFMLVFSCFAISIVSAEGEYVYNPNDFLVFENGIFDNGGSVVADSGTIVAGKYLVGGEGLYKGKSGNGSFHILIDALGTDAAFKAYNYLGITIAPINGDNTTGVYNGGVVEFGKGNAYSFESIEKDGRGIGTVERFGTYYLDLRKVENFNNNELILSHAKKGYEVAAIWLTDTPTLKGITNEDGDPITFKEGDYTYKLSDAFKEEIAKAEDDDIFSVMPQFTGEVDLSTIEDEVKEEIGFNQEYFDNTRDMIYQIYCDAKGISLNDLKTGRHTPDPAEWMEITADFRKERSEQIDLYRQTKRRITDDKIRDYYYACMDELGISRDAVAEMEYHDLWVALSLNLSASKINEILPSERLAYLWWNDEPYDESEDPQPTNGSDAGTSNSYTITQDGLTLKITLDKDVYEIGEEIKASIEFENNSGKDLDYMDFASGLVPVAGIKHIEDGSYFEGGYLYSGQRLQPVSAIMPEMRKFANATKAVKSYIFTGKYFNPKEGYESLDYAEPDGPLIPQAGIYQGEVWVNYASSATAGKNDKQIKLEFPVVISNGDPEEYDLYASNATTSETNLSDGESTALSTVVRNVSDEDIEKEITVEFYMNGKLFDTVTEVATIEAGKFAVITSSKETELYFGTHTISTEVKISDESAIDSDTTNNTTKTRIRVLDN